MLLKGDRESGSAHASWTRAWKDLINFDLLIGQLINYNSTSH